MIEERTIQLNVHGHFEWAALECLKDKLNALSAARGGKLLTEPYEPCVYSVQSQTTLEIFPL